MSSFYLDVGDAVTFTKTVAESDGYLFAGITGDLSPNHVDAEFMKRTRYGRRVVHGELLVGFMSRTSTMIIEQSAASPDETPVSLGYDRIRFLKPVFIGDTITVRYTIESIDTDRRRSLANIEITNQEGTLVTVGKHILKWVKNE